MDSQDKFLVWLICRALVEILLMEDRFTFFTVFYIVAEFSVERILYILLMRTIDALVTEELTTETIVKKLLETKLNQMKK